MAKKINLMQLKNWRGDDVFHTEKDKDGKDIRIIDTLKDAIEGFLIFLHTGFRTAMTMEDWKAINRIQKYIFDCKDNSLIIEDHEYDWLKKKLEEVPAQAVTNREITTKDSYGGLAFGADVIPILEALDNLIKE